MKLVSAIHSTLSQDNAIDISWRLETHCGFHYFSHLLLLICVSNRKLFSRIGPFLKFLPYVYNLGTPTFRQWVLRYNPIKMVRLFAESVKIQTDLAEEVLRARKELIASGGDLSSEPGRGRDLMTLLSKSALLSLGTLH